MGPATSGVIRPPPLREVCLEHLDATGTHFCVSIQHEISSKATILDLTCWY